MARMVGEGGANFVELAGARSRVSAVAIVCSEDPASRFRWNLQVDATTRERGTVRVGRLLTVPPAMFEGLPGVRLARSAGRVIALAACPDAVSWKVTGQVVQSLDAAPLADAVLDVTLTAFEFAVTATGLVPVNADAIGGPELATATSRQLVIAAGVPTLLVPYDADRARMLVSNAGGGDLNVGATPSANVTDYYQIPTGQQWDYIGHRPVWAFSVVGTTATIWTQGY